MIKIGIILPLNIKNQNNPISDTSYLNFLRLISKTGNEIIHISALDICSLTHDGLIYSYSISDNQTTRQNIKAFNVIHFLDFDNYLSKNLTLLEKWLFINKQLDIFKQYNLNYVNSIESLKYFLDKRYLIDISQKGISVIPTRIIDNYQINSFIETNNIIKPSNGECGKFVFQLDNITTKIIQILKTQSKTFIIQPFMPEVYNGEISMVFIGGSYSHSIIKTFDKYKKNLANSAIVHDFIRSSYSPSEKELNFGYNVMESLEYPLDIFRVDFIKGGNSIFLMEVEAVDPYHYPEFILKNYIKRIIELYKSKMNVYV